MNKEFKNEILIEGYIKEINKDDNTIKILNNDDLIEFKYNEDFKLDELEEVLETELVRIKGSFDQDENGIFYLAKDFLVMPNFSQGEM